MYHDPVLARGVVDAVDQAVGEDKTRMEVVTEDLHRQYRQYS